MIVRLTAPSSGAPRRRRGAGFSAWLAMLLGASMLSAGAIAGVATAASAAPALGGDGWVRCAHLSPNTPAVDVYLYAFGNPAAMMVLKHVAYGDVSSYMKVTAGEYTAAMRLAGAAPSAKPVLSTNVLVKAGDAYTIAGMGPASALKLEAFQDQLTTPKGDSLVRVIQASLKEHHVTVTAGADTLARNLAFASISSYLATPPGDLMVHAAGGSETWSGTVNLGAGTIHTLVVLDTSGGLQVNDLIDAAGSSSMPAGGAATGFGGTAPQPGSALPWAAALAAGALLLAGGGYRLRRVRAAARHAR